MRPLTVFQMMPINPRSPRTELEVLPVLLEQTILDFYGHNDPGPHRCGRAEVLGDGRLRITIPDTQAGRHAIAMIEEDLVDVVHWNGSVRLR